MKTTGIVMGLLAAFIAMNSLAVESEISGVMVRQRWPWSRRVDIDYVLNCDPGQSVCVTVEAYDGDVPLPLPSGSLSGDLYNVCRGARRIVWDPTVTAYTNASVLSKFRVELTTTPVPLYMIVDLTRDAGVTGQVVNVYEEDLTNGLWGAWVRNPVTNKGSVIESVVWTGVATNDIYKTDKLVLRRIPATTFKAGEYPPTVSTTLTKDFYAGVFEVTQWQWEMITGDKPSFFDNANYYEARPVEKVSYEDIRGATNSTPTVNWPVTGHTVVAPDSFLGQLRAKTGLTDIDLPTAAQSECLARAGTQTYYNDGELAAPEDGVSQSTSLSNLFLDVVGRYRYNGGFSYNGAAVPAHNVTLENGSAKVGSYRPNAWGLYDTTGNLWELCLDWKGAATGGIDPSGEKSGTQRVYRNGCWNAGAGSCRVGSHGGYFPTSQGYSIGCRLVRTMP